MLVSRCPVKAPCARSRGPSAVKPMPIARARSVATVVAMAAPAKLPTVAETKAKFLEAYPKPVSSIYSTVLQELLVQQHFIRFGKNYMYNEVFALGFVSVFEQVLESMADDERAAIFTAYVQALGEDPARYKKDAAQMEAAAGALPGPDALTPDASGSELQQALARVASASSSGSLAYNKFFAIGLFRLLELTGAKEPAALERLVKSVGVKPEAVNRDLMMYKGILSKLSAAKELMREFVEREKRKQAERDAAKAAKAETSTTVQA